MISVVIRNKNQATALNFLLQLLFTRYKTDIDEVIVLDNLSNDESAIISNKHGARLVSVHDFSYGGSANLAAQEARNQIVVIMSAHSFPVSHDFFQLITKKFVGRETKLAGVRCLHNYGDYISFFNNLNAKDDYNRAGLIFACSAFNKNIWQQHPFKADITTFEDKEWTKRVLAYGYEIDFVESIFCYNIKRSKKQNFFIDENKLVF